MDADSRDSSSDSCARIGERASVWRGADRAHAVRSALCLLVELLIVLSWVAPNAASADQKTHLLSDDRLQAMIGPRRVPNGIGVNIHFVDGHEYDLDLIRQIGFRMIRTDLLWSRVETERSQYNWGPYDALVDGSHKRGLIPLLILDYSNPLYAPSLSAEAGSPNSAYEAPLSNVAQSGFIQFARAAALHYREKGDVIWEIWNEPNLNFGRPIQLRRYLRLALEACKAIHDANPRAFVIGPAVNGFPMAFLDEFLRADHNSCFEGISIHPYRDEAPESVLSDWSQLRHLIANASPPGHPVPVDSEWGYSAIGVPRIEGRQAEYVLRLFLLDLLAGVPITIVYDFRDDGRDPLDKEANFGLLRYSENPGSADAMKPAGAALSALLSSLDGLALIGRVRSSGPEMILAFGTALQPMKLVAWSPLANTPPVVLGPRLCIARSESPGSCRPEDLIAEIAPVAVPLAGKPAVIPVRVQSAAR
jgi:hypothetical protein